MADDEVIPRAAALWAADRRADALNILKNAVRDDRTRDDARLALAEYYREMGNPDQAGRWGIQWDEWLTDLERDRLARLLAASGVAHPLSAREFLYLNGDAPDHLLKLLDGPVSAHRERMRVAVRAERSSTVELAGVAMIVWAVWFLLTLISVIVVVGAALADGISSSAARSTSLVVEWGFVAALSISAVVVTMQRAWRRSLWLWVAAALTASAALWLTVSGWVTR